MVVIGRDGMAEGKHAEHPQDHLEERQPRADVLEIVMEPSAGLLDISRFSSISRLHRTTG